MFTEQAAIRERYSRRERTDRLPTYTLFDPFTLMAEHEKDRAIIAVLRQAGVVERLEDGTVLDVGCGTGSNLLRFVRLGFRPENMVGSDLLEQRIVRARELLPAKVRLIAGDACEHDFATRTFDVVCLFTVFSSILDDRFQHRLADTCWQRVSPGGGILWYDFTYNNPRNPDVKGVSLRRLRALFPEAAVQARRVTLVPPLGRRLCRWWQRGYGLLNSVPFLRSHLLAWLGKPLA